MGNYSRHTSFVYFLLILSLGLFPKLVFADSGTSLASILSESLPEDVVTEQQALDYLDARAAAVEEFYQNNPEMFPEGVGVGQGSSDANLFFRNLPEPTSISQDEYVSTSLYSGALTYTYPFVVPPGTAGLTPPLFLFYNSQKTNSLDSIIGAGWDLSQSYIERDVNFTLYNVSDDFFKLIIDGGEFRLENSSSDGRLHTQIETYMDIEERTGAQNEKGDFWVVRMKDGKTLTFGQRNSSELVALTNTYVSRWYLDQVEDVHGNAIYYNYTEIPYLNDTGPVYPVSIIYNNDSERAIYFNYEFRPKYWLYLDSRNQFQRRNRLKQIIVSAEGSTIRSYNLSYSEILGNPRSFLANITEYDATGTQAKPPIYFNYEKPNSTFSNASQFRPPQVFVDGAFGGPKYGAQIVDVNGDGLADEISSTQVSGNLQSYAYINNGSWFNHTSDPKWALPKALMNYDDNKLDTGARLADINGDGRIDLVYSKTNASGWNDNGTWLNNGTGWQRDDSVVLPYPIATSAAPYYTGANVVDVNNDGYADFVISIHNGTSQISRTWLNNKHGFTEESEFIIPPAMYYYNIIGGVPYVYSNGCRFTDLNGDGLTDISCGWGWINNGSAFVFSSELKLPYFLIWECGNAGTELFDINSDSLADVAKSETVTQSGTAVNETWINFGSYFENIRTWNIPLALWEYIHYQSQYRNTCDNGVRLADVNGDGFTDEIQGLKQDSDYHYRAYTNNGISYKLSQIQTRSGENITITYRPSTSLNNYDANGIAHLPFNVWVVSSISKTNGMSGSSFQNSTTYYNYSGGMWNGTLREFFGFGVANVTLPDGTKEIHFFHQDRARRGMEYLTIIANSSQSPYSKNEYTWIYNQTGGIFQTNLLEERTYFYDGESDNPKVSAISYSYDQYGNILNKTTSGDISISGDEKYENFQYTYNAAAWILNKPISYNLTDSSNHLFRQSFYYYDDLPYNSSPTKGLLTMKEDVLTGSSNPLTTYSYDSFGNLISQTDPLNHTTRFIYNVTDRTFTFPEKTINALNQTSTSLYDLGTGNLLSTTDSNGITTNYTYDNFGRLINVIKPYDGPIYPTTIYEYEFDGIAPEKIKTSQREYVGSPSRTFDSYQFYDGLGNLIQTRSESEDPSLQIITDSFYDSMNRLSRKSNPYSASQSENYTTPNSTIPFSNISYDPLSRIIKTTNPDNTFKSFTYSKWNTTITDEKGNQIKQIQDAYGQITEIQEFNSATPYITKYAYDSAGQLINITDNENNIFQFTYDTLGRKTSLSDPDLGIWNYSYDAASNLITQKDNRSITTTLQYDSLNRLTHKSASPLAFTYYYDEQLNGTLSRILSTSYAASYSYDNRYRKTSELKSIENNLSRTNYTYDSMDRITSAILPNSETIYYTYSTQNQLSSIDGILPLAQYNAFNKPILRSYANSLNTSFTYDFPTSRLTRISTTGIQDLNYQYDNTSNILQINDAYNSILQTMGYDKLNRLTYASRTDNSPQHENYILNYSYSSIGNILSISENNANSISTYSYTNSPVHAPKSISQTGPLLETKDLQLVNTNGTLKTFRFKIKNNANHNISSINFTFFTGASQINSTIPIYLKPQESILVFISYNYSNLTEYKVTARAGNTTFLSQQSLTIGQTSASSNSNLTQSFLYDANGNLITDVQYYYEYNSFNQLSKIREHNSTGFIISEYLYDPDGNRIRKTDHLKNETILYINPNFLRVINATGTYDTIYYFADSQLIARKDPDGKKYFYHPDHLGSTTIVTNESGAVVEDTNYKPFGEPLYDAKSRFLYTGKEKDSESGLMYYGARYYSPFIGKFLQPDTMIQFPYSPQSLNRYSYVQNNPYKFVDESGNFITLPAAVAGAIIGGVLGGAISAGTQYLTTEEVNWADVGRASVVGGVAGGVAGLTGGVSLLATVGSSVASGRAAQVAENALTGQDLTNNLLDPGGIGLDFALGGIGHGIGKALGGTGDSISVFEGELNSGSKSSLRGAANPSTREAIDRGLAEHKNFYNIMGEKGMITNKAIPGYRIRPDAIDLNNRVIYELKPEGRLNLKSTRDQVSGYVDAAKNADWSKYGKPADWGKSGAWSFEIVPYR